MLHASVRSSVADTGRMDGACGWRHRKWPLRSRHRPLGCSEVGLATGKISHGTCSQAYLSQTLCQHALFVVQPCSGAALLLRLMRIVHLDTVMGSDVAVASPRELSASHRILVMRFVGNGDATPCRGPQSGSVALRKTKTGQQRFEPMSHHVFADAWQYVVMAFAGLLR
jgi:hypothetical protein